MDSSSAGNAGLQPGSSLPLPTSTWQSRGYLPHFDATQYVQHVTYHLADSLPASTLERFQSELRATAPKGWRDAERRREVEEWLDAGHGSCFLKEPSAARTVQNAFLHFDAVRYRLIAWVVMPNHVHVLFEPQDGWSVARIVSSWKTFTGRRLATMKGAPTRPVWHREYWDRFIRDSQHLSDTRKYIHENPVKAGLVARAVEWEWSSAR